MRLTEEKGNHIIENRPYMVAYYEKVLAAVEDLVWILRVYAAALVAVLLLARNQYLHVVYRAMSQDDDFIITAFLATKVILVRGRQHKAMADQLTTVSKMRLLNHMGRLSGADMQKVEQAVKVQLSLSDATGRIASLPADEPKPGNGSPHSSTP